MNKKVVIYSIVFILIMTILSAILGGMRWAVFVLVSSSLIQIGWAWVVNDDYKHGK
jgi:DNA-binding transcriptional regulator of glucitol operon